MSRGWWAALLLVVACNGGTDPTTTTITSTSAVPAGTTTSVVAETGYLRSVSEVVDLPISIYAPETMGSYPVVVLFHGGGWFGGAPISTAPLADYLASQGIVVFNATYRTSGGGYPESFDDVACAVRFARASAPTYSDASVPLVVVGHSAGAHLASVVALAGDEFGEECSVEGSAVPDRFVGLAGPYDPTLYRQVLPAFFGTRFENDPTPWEGGSPYSYFGNNSELAILLMHGATDELVPISSSELFAEALAEAGYEVKFIEVAGAPHQALRDPNVVGPQLAAFLKER